MRCSVCDNFLAWCSAQDVHRLANFANVISVTHNRDSEKRATGEETKLHAFQTPARGGGQQRTVKTLRPASNTSSDIKTH